jgi:hypothetical protein
MTRPSTPRLRTEPWLPPQPTTRSTARGQLQATPLCHLVHTHYAHVRDGWEERCESRYGFLRGFADMAIGAYLDCGILESGLARVRCGKCRAEFLVAFSCKGRGPTMEDGHRTRTSYLVRAFASR